MCVWPVQSGWMTEKTVKLPVHFIGDTTHRSMTLCLFFDVPHSAPPPLFSFLSLSTSCRMIEWILYMWSESKHRWQQAEAERSHKQQTNKKNSIEWKRHASRITLNKRIKGNAVGRLRTTATWRNGDAAAIPWWHDYDWEGVPTSKVKNGRYAMPCDERERKEWINIK